MILPAYAEVGAMESAVGSGLEVIAVNEKVDVSE